MMYRLLKQRLPGLWPEVIMAAWYSLLVFIVLLCATIPDGPFHYLGM